MSPEGKCRSPGSTAMNRFCKSPAWQRSSAFVYLFYG